MKYALALLILLLSSTVATALTQREHVEYQMWLEACKWTQYSCYGIEPPLVQYERITDSLGYYQGSQTIYVSNRLSGMQLKEVVFHETVHYLQVVVGGAQVPGWAYGICKLEEEAFYETDRFLVRFDKAYLQRGDRWWWNYSYCYQWYDPEWTPNWVYRWSI